MEEEQQQLKKGGRTIAIKQDEYRAIVQFHIDGTIPLFEGKNMAQKKHRFVSKAQMFVLNGSKRQGGGDVEWPHGQTLSIRCKNTEGEDKLKLFVPSWEAYKILNRFHPINDTLGKKSKGLHLGENATYRAISMEHYGISQGMVSDHIKSCKICEQYNPINKPPKDIIPILSSEVNERWVIDTTYMHDFKDENDGYEYIGVIIDHFSKYSFAFPMRTKSAEEWAANLVRIMLENDAPEILHSDNGTEFVNGIITAIGKLLDLDLRNGQVYNPQEQGIVEKLNGTIKQNLAKLMAQKKTKRWITLLPVVMSGYNVTPQTTTRVSPFRLYHGRDPKRLTGSIMSNELHDIKNWTPEQYEEFMKKQDEVNSKLIEIVKLRIDKNAARMEERFAESSKEVFEIDQRVLVCYKVFEPRKQWGKAKKKLLQEYYPQRGKIVATSKNGARFDIKLDGTNEVIERIPPRLLKHETTTVEESLPTTLSNALATPTQATVPDNAPSLHSDGDSDDSESESESGSESDSDLSHSDSLSAAFALGVLKANTRRQQAKEALASLVAPTSEKPSASRQLKSIIKAAQKQALQ